MVACYIIYYVMTSGHFVNSLSELVDKLLLRRTYNINRV